MSKVVTCKSWISEVRDLTRTFRRFSFWESCWTWSCFSTFVGFNNGIACILGVWTHSFILRWPRRCHCTCQPLVYDCSPHSPACGLLKCQMQFSAVLSDHVNPSFPLSTPLSGSMYIAVVCYFGVSFVLHPIQKSECFRIFNEFRCLNSWKPPNLNMSEVPQRAKSWEAAHTQFSEVLS